MAEWLVKSRFFVELGKYLKCLLFNKRERFGATPIFGSTCWSGRVFCCRFNKDSMYGWFMCLWIFKHLRVV